MLRLHTLREYEPLLADAMLLRFAAPDPSAYSSLEVMAREAVERGYEAIR